jgi:hypothetical protein
MKLIARRRLAFSVLPALQIGTRRRGTQGQKASVPGPRAEREAVARPSALDRPYLDNWIRWTHGR